MKFSVLSLLGFSRILPLFLSGPYFLMLQAGEPVPLGPQTLSFGSSGPFTGWTDHGGGDLVRGGGPNSQTLSFDLWNETAGSAAGVLAGPGGLADFTIKIDLVNPFNPYNGAPLNPAKTTTHDVKQDGSGFISSIPWGTAVANAGRTGDTAGARITVTFADHLVATADSFQVGMTSVNTAGSAFESSATNFRWAGGIGYADYDGFYSTPPLGPSNLDGLQQVYAIDTMPWTTTSGAFSIGSTGTVSVTGTDARTISPGTTGLFDNANVRAVLDAGVSSGSFIKGFEWVILLEDVRGLDADGNGTISLAEFAASTGTNSSLTATLTQMAGSFVVIPEPSRAMLMLAAAGFVFASRRRR